METTWGETSCFSDRSSWRILEEFQCGLHNYLKAEKKSPRTTISVLYFIFIFMYVFRSGPTNTNWGIFFKLFPVKNLQMTMEFFNHSDQEFLEIPIEFRLGKAAGLSAFVCCIIAPNLVWSWGRRSDYISSASPFDAKMLYRYIVALHRASNRVSCELIQ